MKIVTGLLGLLCVLTVIYFVQVWREIPQVDLAIQSQVPHSETVQIGLSSAETVTPTPTPSGSGRAVEVPSPKAVASPVR